MKNDWWKLALTSWFSELVQAFRQKNGSVFFCRTISEFSVMGQSLKKFISFSSWIRTSFWKIFPDLRDYRITILDSRTGLRFRFQEHVEWLGMYSSHRARLQILEGRWHVLWYHSIISVLDGRWWHRRIVLYCYRRGWCSRPTCRLDIRAVFRRSIRGVVQYKVTFSSTERNF